MPSEAERLDLYNGLVELLGPVRAETFMASLPSFDMTQLATKTDLAMLEARMGALEGRMASLEGAMVALGALLDRMYLTLVAGFFVIVAAMVGVIVSV